MQQRYDEGYKPSAALAFCCNVQSWLVCMAIQAEVCDLRKYVPAGRNCRVRQSRDTSEWRCTIPVSSRIQRLLLLLRPNNAMGHMCACKGGDCCEYVLTEAMKVVFAKIHLLHVPEAAPRGWEGACGSRTDKENQGRGGSSLAIADTFVNLQCRIMLCSSMGCRSRTIPVSVLPEMSKYVKHPSRAHSEGKVPEKSRMVSKHARACN